MKCAVFELPFEEGESFGEGAADLLGYLAEKGVVRHAGAKWYWADRSYPAENVSLRTSTPENVVIVDTTRGRDEVIGEMDMPSAKLLVFDHAIYIHLGDQFAVKSLDLENRRCFVEETDTDYWTDSIVKTDIKVLVVDEERTAAGTRAALGDILVRTQATKFKKLKYHTNENVGYGDITLPADEMHTRSAVLLFDGDTAPGRAFAALSDTARGIVIQRLGVLLRTVAPVFLLCDPRDLGVSERVRDPHFEAPCLYVYDQYPGGIGLSEGFLGSLPQIVRGAREVVEKCPCENGCPSCIGAPDEPGRRGNVACRAGERACGDRERETRRARIPRRMGRRAGIGQGPGALMEREGAAVPSRTRRRIDFLRAGPETASPPDTRHVGSSSAKNVGDPRFPDWKREGEYLYRRRQYFSGRGVGVWPDRFSPEAGAVEDLVFYDTETTGISGGAGSVIFLFGAAWCEGRDLAVEQLFLSDFPGEPEFLLAVRELLRPYRAHVSYNGKTFDSHLLRTRFRMNRIPWEPGPQVDLLHHSRRLWKSVVGDCSLRSMESHVLGFTRERDVAGEDIPLIWLEFLRTGRPGTLPVVFDHNIMDIVSLARLYDAIGGLIRGGQPPAGVDERALGTWLIRTGDASGVAMLEAAFRRGSMQAGIALALHHKRRHEWDRAADVWTELLDGTRSLMAAVELAKHHEHRTRRYEAALGLVETALSWSLPLDSRTRHDVRKRRDRLQRKIEAETAKSRERTV